MMDETNVIVLPEEDYAVLPLKPVSAERHDTLKDMLSLAVSEGDEQTLTPESNGFLASASYLQKMRETLEAPEYLFSLEDRKERLQSAIDGLMYEVHGAAERTTRNLLLIGYIIAMGDELGIHQRLTTGYSNMFDFLINNEGIMPDIVRIATKVYEGWVHAKKYGFGIEEIAHATTTHIRRITQEDNESDKRYEEIKRTKLQELAQTLNYDGPIKESDLGPLERQTLYQDADTQLQQEMRERIEQILATPEMALIDEVAPKGEIEKPYICIRISYAPEAKMLSWSAGSVYLDETSLRTIESRGAKIEYRLADMSEPDTLAKTATHILTHCPPEPDDNNDNAETF